MLREAIALRFILATLSTIAIQNHQANGSWQPENNENIHTIQNKFDNIFKIGTGKVVFKGPPLGINTKPVVDDENIICGEHDAGKSHCREALDNLDQIHPEQFEKFAAFFKDDYAPPKNVTNRIDGIDEEYYCNSKSRIIHPKGGETRQAKWVQVVQHRQYKQGVLVEQCVRENVRCKFNELLPLGISSKCKQHFVYRTMVVYVGGVLKEEMIKLPNYCDCALSFNPTRRRN